MRILLHEKYIDTIHDSELQSEVNIYFNRDDDDESDMVFTSDNELEHYRTLRDALGVQTEFDNGDDIFDDMYDEVL